MKHFWNTNHICDTFLCDSRWLHVITPIQVEQKFKIQLSVTLAALQVLSNIADDEHADSTDRE